MSPQSSSPDSVRYSQKLWRYLLALDVISKALQEALETQGIVDEPDFHRILQEVLPGLKQAFNSEIAFYADREGRIRLIEPEDSALAGKIFPSSKRINRLLEVGEPLVIMGSKDTYPELNTLGVQSLLIVRLLVPWGGYLVGVCNGQDDPAYDGSDKKFFNKILKIWELGIQYGHTQKEIQKEQTETQLAYERYLDAQLRGEYNLLFRDGGDYARRLLKLGGDS